MLTSFKTGCPCPPAGRGRCRKNMPVCQSEFGFASELEWTLVVVLDQSATFAEDVHAALVAVVDLVPADGRIRIGGDLHTGKIIGMNPVLDELALTGFVDVDAACLALLFGGFHSAPPSDSLRLYDELNKIVGITQIT